MANDLVNLDVLERQLDVLHHKLVDVLVKTKLEVNVVVNRLHKGLVGVCLVALVALASEEVDSRLPGFCGLLVDFRLDLVDPLLDLVS